MSELKPMPPLAAPIDEPKALPIAANDNPANDNPIVDAKALEPKPLVEQRKKSWGERLFNYGTYGGFYLLGNEATTTIICENAKHGVFQKQFQKTGELIAKTPVLNQWDYAKRGRMNYILWALIGGMGMVFPVKWMEDHKGSIVRRIDRKIYGNAVETDPQLQQEHAEMDAAPKQSWSSLWKGRISTVIGALSLDYLILDAHGVSSKLITHPKLQNVSSFERACVTGIRKLADKINPSGKDARALAVDHAHPFDIQPAEGKLLGWANTGIFMLTLSVTLTFVFYSLSKLFATRSAEKKEEKREEEGLAPVGGVIYHADRALPQQAVAHTGPSTQIFGAQAHAQGMGNPFGERSL